MVMQFATWCRVGRLLWPARPGWEHRHLSDRRGRRLVRCPVCHLATSLCLCADLARLREQAFPGDALPRTLAPPGASDFSFRFFLLYHSRELDRPSNTGNLLPLLFPTVTTTAEWSRPRSDTSSMSLLSAPDWDAALPWLQQLQQPAEESLARTILLFPRDDDQPEPPSFSSRLAALRDSATPLTPVRFVLLDARFSEARRMLRTSPALQVLPQLDVSLIPPPPSPVARPPTPLRTPVRAQQLATARAAALALTWLGSTTAATWLLESLAIFEERFWQSRGGPPTPVSS
jgi:DTW domain-containing protein YfiP